MTAGHGVLISHISEESPVALVLKKYLRIALGDDFPVFVSTDKTSIEPGQRWYDTVIQGLTSAESGRRTPFGGIVAAVGRAESDV
jgi:hypothetical protein